MSDICLSIKCEIITENSGGGEGGRQRSSRVCGIDVRVRPDLFACVSCLHPLLLVRPACGVALLPHRAECASIGVRLLCAGASRCVHSDANRRGSRGASNRGCMRRCNDASDADAQWHPFYSATSTRKRRGHQRGDSEREKRHGGRHHSAPCAMNAGSNVLDDFFSRYLARGSE